MWNTKHVICKHIPNFEKWPHVSWVEPWLRNLSEPMEPLLRNLSKPNVSWMEPSLRNLSKPNISWMEPGLRNLSEPNVSWMEPSLRNLSEPNVSWMEPSLRNLSKPNVSWMEPSLRNLSKPNVSWMEPWLRNLSEPNVSWTEPSLRNLSEPNVSWMEPSLRNLSKPNISWMEPSLRNLSEPDVSWMEPSLRNLRNLTFHEWNLHFGTSRNLTFHEWNLHFGTSRNLTFHEWNLDFGTGSIPSEPLGTWCKVSGGCPKPPRSFIGRTPSLSGCWGTKEKALVRSLFVWHVKMWARLPILCRGLLCTLPNSFRHTIILNLWFFKAIFHSKPFILPTIVLPAPVARIKHAALIFWEVADTFEHSSYQDIYIQRKISAWHASKQTLRSHLLQGNQKYSRFGRCSICQCSWTRSCQASTKQCRALLAKKLLLTVQKAQSGIKQVL